MNMTTKMFVVTLTTVAERKHVAYFDTNEDAFEWIHNMLHNEVFGFVKRFVVDNRDVHITEFI
jgi:hypothetical protein